MQTRMDNEEMITLGTCGAASVQFLKHSQLKPSNHLEEESSSSSDGIEYSDGCLLMFLNLFDSILLITDTFYRIFSENIHLHLPSKLSFASTLPA